MGKKESNEARMLGIIPSEGADPIPVGKIPDGATQVTKQEGGSTSGAVIHEVDGGKTFYLTTALPVFTNGDSSEQYANFYVANNAKVEQYSIFTFYLRPNSQLAGPLSFQPPLEIPAGWNVMVKTGHADCTAWAFIHGYEI